MKLGFSTLGCPGWSIEQIADFAAANGVDGVELRTHDDGNHLSPASTPERVEAVAGIFKSRGARVTALMGYTGFVSEERSELAGNRDKLIRLADIAGVLGASYIRMFMRPLPKGVTHEQVVMRAAPFIAEACDYAAGKGVRICSETHDDWCSPAVSAGLVAKVGHGLGLVWDICNASNATGLSVEEQYAVIGEHVVYCHIKDSVKKANGDLQYVEPGQGDCEIKRAVELLKKDKPGIFLSFEHEKKWIPALPEPEKAFPQYLKYMRSIC